MQNFIKRKMVEILFICNSKKEISYAEDNSYNRK